MNARILDLLDVRVQNARLLYREAQRRPGFADPATLVKQLHAARVNRRAAKQIAVMEAETAAAVHRGDEVAAAGLREKLTAARNQLAEAIAISPSTLR